MSGIIHQVRQGLSKVKLQEIHKDLGEVLKDLSVPEKANISSAMLALFVALGIITSPGVGVAIPALSLVGSVIDSYQKRKKRKLTSVEEFVAITAPLSYCQSFEELSQNFEKLNLSLTLPRNIQSDTALLEFELDKELAKEALTCFHKSTLGRAYNTVLARFLKEGGLKETERKIIAGWVGWKTEAYLAKAVEEAGDNVDGVVRSYSIGRERESLYQSIQDYCENTIQKLPLEPVLGENFTLQQVYVPLKAKVGDKEVILEDWVKERLKQDSKNAIVILGGPGSGKTVFCRMFAHRVRERLHPLWIPIFLRLRDINNFARGLEEILERQVTSSLGKDWLQDDSQRYLIFLDGFDELRMEGREFGAEKFLRQVISFPQKTRHGIILTGRPLAFHGLHYPKKEIAEITLLPMDNSLQEQWLEKWEVLVGREKKERFRAFLDSEAPTTVKEELAGEPLLLYLLAAMHRDGKIKAENLVSLGDRGRKIEIYNQSLEWVLTKQRPEDLQKDLVELSGTDLEQVLMSAAICVVQSGGEYGKIAAVEERLKKSYPCIADEIAKMGDNKKQEEALRNAFAAFYLKPAEEGAVEFFHKSFSEFLTAKAMEQSFSQWVKPGARNRGFEVSQEEVEKEIYDLFGYGSLTQEILEYLFGLLERNKEFKPKVLFQRLKDFYLRWCDGEYIDAVPPPNYPQEKMIQLRKAQPELGEKTTWGVRQVDIYTGLNVMILLLELQRYGERHDLEMSFHLCGEVKEDGKPEDPNKLSRIINYSDCLNNGTFSSIVGDFLSGANLYNAYLKNAYLKNADLKNANLYNANLYNADLKNANLYNAKLYNAKLYNANLYNAKLYNAKLKNANLQAIKWNENTKWEGVEGLETARNVPEELKRQLSLNI